MRKAAGTARRISAGTVAVRLCAVLAVCVGMRTFFDAAEGSPDAGTVPDGLGIAALALTLPGAEGGNTGAGELALGVSLPGWQPSVQDRDGAREPDRNTGGRVLASGGVSVPDGQGSMPDGQGSVPESVPDGQEGREGREGREGQEGREPAPDTRTDPAPDGTSSAPETGGSDTPSPDAPPQNDAIGTTITGTGSGYQNGGEGIYLKNRTKYDIYVSDYIDLPLDFSAGDGAAVLIVHTHGSEAYNPAGEDIYVPSDPSRTEDKTYNVVRVGDELARVLEERGIRVIHDRELYDYPTYTGSYDRSLASIKRHLEETPEIKVVIDLHRDALEGDGKLYKTVADVGERPCAQVMLICGSNSSGLNHPNWEKNLTFALKIQREMVTDYPTLARPLKISEYRYNQHATAGSLIAEIGTNGNTLQEALEAVRYFGECLADVLEAR